jgi:hypothetical protein
MSHRNTEGARASRRATIVTRAACPDCRLRFTVAAAAYLPACPGCGEPLQALNRADAVVGFRLFKPEISPPSLPGAVAVSMPVPDPDAGRS